MAQEVMVPMLAAAGKVAHPLASKREGGVGGGADRVRAGGTRGRANLGQAGDARQ